MEKLLLDLKKIVKDFNTEYKGKGFKVKYHLGIPIFCICLHQHMLSLGLDTYYSAILRHLNLLQVFWPDLSLHAPSHLNSPKTTNADDTQ